MTPLSLNRYAMLFDVHRNLVENSNTMSTRAQRKANLRQLDQLYTELAALMAQAVCDAYPEHLNPVHACLVRLPNAARRGRVCSVAYPRNRSESAGDG